MHQDANAHIELEACGSDDSRIVDEAAREGLPEPGFPVWGTLLLTIGLVTLVLVAVNEHFDMSLRLELQTKERAVPNALLSSIRAMEADHLSHYRWVKRSEGIVRIPLQRAVELVIRDYAQIVPEAGATLATDPGYEAAAKEQR